MFRFTQPKDNAVAATYQYLKAIGAKVTEETVEETLKTTPITQVCWRQAMHSTSGKLRT